MNAVAVTAIVVLAAVVSAGYVIVGIAKACEAKWGRS